MTKSRQAKAQKKKVGKVAASAANNSVRSVFAPVSTSTIIHNPIRHRFIGYRGGPSDVDTNGATTLVGSSILCNLRYSVSGQGVLETSTGTGFYQSSLTPGRFPALYFLYNLFDVYDRYRFRRVRIHFIPNLPSTTSGSFAFALKMAGGPSTVQVDDAMEIANRACSVISPAYAPASLPEYRSNGSVTWETSTEYDYPQLTLEGATFNTLQVGDVDATGVLGQLYIEYELDLFGPKANQGTPSVALDRLKRSLRSEVKDLLSPFLSEIERVISPSSTSSSSSSSSSAANTGSDGNRDSGFIRVTPLPMKR